MELQNIQSHISSASAQDPEKKSQMGQQQFLQLLVSQMRHQDPINPLDGADFAAQLAQFNSVEQLINVNNGIQQLQMSQDMMSAGLTNSLAASLTGKNVKALSDSVPFTPGESSQIQFKLNHSATELDVIIMNKEGREVRRESMQHVAAGDNTWEWDGRNDAGNRLPEGEYHVRIEARDDEGSNLMAITYIEGMASKVRYTSEGVKLSIHGIEVPIGDVEEVGILF